MKDTEGSCAFQFTQAAFLFLDNNVDKFRLQFDRPDNKSILAYAYTTDSTKNPYFTFDDKKGYKIYYNVPGKVNDICGIVKAKISILSETDDILKTCIFKIMVDDNMIDDKDIAYPNEENKTLEELFESFDKGATSVQFDGIGNAVTSGSYDEKTRMITLSKDKTFSLQSAAGNKIVTSIDNNYRLNTILKNSSNVTLSQSGVDLSALRNNLVPETRKIANLDLSDNITVEELKRELAISESSGSASNLSTPSNNGYETDMYGNFVPKSGVSDSSYFNIFNQDKNNSVKIYYNSGNIETPGEITAGRFNGAIDRAASVKRTELFNGNCQISILDQYPHGATDIYIDKDKYKELGFNYSFEIRADDNIYRFADFKIIETANLDPDNSYRQFLSSTFIYPGKSSFLIIAGVFIELSRSSGNLYISHGSCFCQQELISTQMRIKKVYGYEYY